jgi:hypothetical protein
VLVYTDSLPVHKHKRSAEAAIKRAANADLGGIPFSALHHARASNPWLQVADYCAWAIRRKWEIGDLRTYDQIRPRLAKVELNITAVGDGTTYLLATSRARRRLMTGAERADPAACPRFSSRGRTELRRSSLPSQDNCVSSVRAGRGFYFFGRIVRSARSRSCRAISIGSPLSTSRAASSQTSCCAERISASTISMARSLRRSSPGDAVPDACGAFVGIHRA